MVRIVPRVVLEVAAIIAAAIAALVEVPPALIERWYSLEIYPRVQHVLTPVSNLLPFALLDVLVVATTATVVFTLVRSVRGAWLERRPGILLATLGHLAASAAVAY